jgi:hypothetical protein
LMQIHSPEVRRAIKTRLVHEVHTSERRSYRGCRRRWHWVYQEFYYPQVTAKPLEFGVAFHQAMETIYNPDTWSFDRTIIKNAAIVKFVNRCEQQKKAYLELNGENYLTNEEVETDYKERVELGVGMIEYYMNDVAPYVDVGWTPIRVEADFLVPVQNPSTGEYLYCKCARCWKTYCNYIDNVIEVDTANWIPLAEQAGEHENWQARSPGLLVCLAGRIDLLAEDNDGHYWIVDWKTTARLARGDISGQEHDEFLELDDQIGSYVMALRRKLGLNVRGFVYVELKKAVPQPPQRNTTTRLGRAYSVNRMQPTDFDLYYRTVKENDTKAFEAGLYDDHLKWLKEEGTNYHARYQVMKTDEELEEIERNLYMEAKEMITPDLPIYYSAGRFSCSFCAFRQPCIEKNRQGDFQFILDNLFEKRDKHYWVKEVSTDTQGGE